MMKRTKLSELNKNLLKKLSRNLAFRPFLGADPEFFIANPRGKILNSDRFFPHKNKPKRVSLKEALDNSSAEGKIYFDGIQAEFGMSPVICRVYFIMAVKHILKEIQQDIGKNKIVLRPSVMVRKDILNKAHPDAKIFGCMPDYNAYTLTINTPPMNAEKHPFRYAGGHIHIGLIDTKYRPKPIYKRQAAILQNEAEHIRWVKALDLFVNLLTLPLDNSPSAKRRRSKYGKAGCFRPTPYGIEYRSLSCWWLKSPIFVSLVLGLAQFATAQIYNKNGYETILKILNISEEDVRGAINESDSVYAKKVWESSRALLSKIYGAMNPLYSPVTKTSPNAKIANLRPVTLLNYLIMEGTDGLIASEHPVDEWELHSRHTYMYHWGNSHSFCYGLRQRISNFMGVNEAIKYEAALMKSL